MGIGTFFLSGLPSTKIHRGLQSFFVEEETYIQMLHWSRCLSNMRKRVGHTRRKVLYSDCTSDVECRVCEMAVILLF